MGRPQPLGQRAQHVMVRACLTYRLDHGARDLKMGVSAGEVKIIMFQECRRGQDDVGHLRSLGHELFMHTNEKIVTTEARTDLAQIRRDIHRVGVLNEQCGNRGSVPQVARVARQDRPDP